MELLNQANRLEGILRKFLNCNYNEFSVKANDNFLKYDWRSPINFALGFLYAKNPDLKTEIENFLGNILYGDNIQNVIEENNDFEKGLKEVEKIITALDKLLNQE